MTFPVRARTLVPLLLFMASQAATAQRATKAGRIAAQILGGAVGGFAVGFVAWRAFDDPEGTDRRVKGDAGYTPNANTAYALGSFVGATLGVHLFGERPRPNIGLTAIGVAIPTIPMLAMRHEPYLPVLGLLVGAPLQAIGGTVAYRLAFRRRQ